MVESTDELDTEVLLQGWAALEARKPSVRVTLDFAARTDIGRTREHNEDKFDFFVPTDPTQLALRGSLYAVADGMGGHHAGQIASEVCLKTLIRSYFSASSKEDTEEALRAAVQDANALIHHAARQFEKSGGMGTTLVAVVLKDDVLTIAHVGDSRLYLLRAGEPIKGLTTDHSFVEEQVRRGIMTRAEAEASPYRNYILRSIGVDRTVEVDVSQITIQVGDIYLICSDGLCGYVGEEKISLLASNKCASQAVLDLIDTANDAGGRDNATALILRVTGLSPYLE